MFIMRSRFRRSYKYDTRDGKIVTFNMFLSYFCIYIVLDYEIWILGLK